VADAIRMAPVAAADPAGWRDRALIETLYSCGMRASEAVALDWPDVDPEVAMVLIRHGKNDKWRSVPIGEPALDPARSMATTRPL
jgi:integrase/recombinase XerD